MCNTLATANTEKSYVSKHTKEENLGFGEFMGKLEAAETVIDDGNIFVIVS